MALNQSFLYPIFFLLLAGFVSSSTHISNGVFDSHGTTGRNLLQMKKKCPVDFEHMNYTILTSQCKGPQYPAKACCDALAEFVCPVVDEVNDLTTDCAQTMFSYINLYGRYPPGLFANLCRGGQQGLGCMLKDSAMPAVTKPTILLMFPCGLLFLLFHLF